MGDPVSPTEQTVGWAALAELYHRYVTGLILALCSRQGTARTTEVVFRTFRRQHLDLFLAGLDKLGLRSLPPAVACAQYHVLSNALGGVKVVWIPESDTKSWVRYLPPRWIFDGTAVCAVPTEVSRAMLWGWHGHNGVTLGNDRLGFVCTSQTTDGQPGLEGYYIEEDRPLEPAERVRFRPGERPGADPVPLPAPDWEPSRLAKVERNYSMAYVRSLLPELCAVLGPADAAAVGRVAARQVAMQYHEAVMGPLGLGARPFAERLAELLSAHGDPAEVDRSAPPAITGRAPGTTIRQRRQRVLADLELPPEAFEAWNGLWEGLAAMEDQRLDVVARADRGDDATEWVVRPSARGA